MTFEGWLEQVAVFYRKEAMRGKERLNLPNLDFIEPFTRARLTCQCDVLEKKAEALERLARIYREHWERSDSDYGKSELDQRLLLIFMTNFEG